jgi:hypothetical protein
MRSEASSSADLHRVVHMLQTSLQLFIHASPAQKCQASHKNLLVPGLDSLVFSAHNIVTEGGLQTPAAGCSFDFLRANKNCWPACFLCGMDSEITV